MRSKKIKEIELRDFSQTDISELDTEDHRIMTYLSTLQRYDMRPLVSEFSYTTNGTKSVFSGGSLSSVGNYRMSNYLDLQTQKINVPLNTEIRGFMCEPFIVMDKDKKSIQHIYFFILNNHKQTRYFIKDKELSQKEFYIWGQGLQNFELGVNSFIQTEVRWTLEKKEELSAFLLTELTAIEKRKKSSIEYAAEVLSQTDLKGHYHNQVPDFIINDTIDAHMFEFEYHATYQHILQQDILAKKVSDVWCINPTNIDKIYKIEDKTNLRAHEAYELLDQHALQLGFPLNTVIEVKTSELFEIQEPGEGVLAEDLCCVCEVRYQDKNRYLLLSKGFIKEFNQPDFIHYLHTYPELTPLAAHLEKRYLEQHIQNEKNNVKNIHKI